MSSVHSPSFQSLHLCHSSFSNPSLALPTSQLIFQPFRCFTYVTAHSPALLSLLLRHRIFTYVTWRAAHGYNNGTYFPSTLYIAFPSVHIALLNHLSFISYQNFVFYTVSSVFLNIVNSSAVIFSFATFYYQPTF